MIVVKALLFFAYFYMKMCVSGVSKIHVDNVVLMCIKYTMEKFP